MKENRFIIFLVFLCLAGCGNNANSSNLSGSTHLSSEAQENSSAEVLSSENTLSSNVLEESSPFVDSSDTNETSTREFDFAPVRLQFGSDYQSKNVRVNGITFNFGYTHYDSSRPHPVLNVAKNDDLVAYVEIVKDLSLDSLINVEYNISAFNIGELDNLGGNYFIGLQYYDNDLAVWCNGESTLTANTIGSNPHIVQINPLLNTKKVRIAFETPNFSGKDLRFLIESMVIRGSGDFLDEPIDEKYILPSYDFEEYLANGFKVEGDVSEVNPGLNFKETGAALKTPIYDVAGKPTKVTLSMKLNGGNSGNIADNNIFSIEGYNSEGQLVEIISQTGMRHSAFQNIIFEFEQINICQYRLIYTYKAKDGQITGGNYQVQTITIERVL